MTLVQAMRILYTNEINCKISSFWDSGWDVSIGDEANGFKTQTMVNDPDEAGEWLIEQALRFYPKLDIPPT